MSKTTLPIDVWWLIIQEIFYGLSISITYPFNNHPVENSALNDWIKVPDFHSNWGNLRLVCRSWKDIADSNSIKYFHLDLQKRPFSNSDYNPEPINLVLEQTSQFNTEILVNVDGPFLNAILSNPLFPRLKTLHVNCDQEDDDSSSLLPGHLLSSISKSFPRLECLYFVTRNGCYFPHEDILDLPNIRSLALIDRSGGGLGELSYTEWKVPSLEYLQLLDFATVGETRRLFQGLEVIGARLKTLKLSLAVPNAMVPFATLFPLDAIWKHCPMLEEFGFHLVVSVHYPPPVNHPLHLLINTSRNSLAYDVIAPIEHLVDDPANCLPPFFECVQNVKIFRDVHDWSDHLAPDGVVPAFRSSLETKVTNLLIRTSLEADSLGTRYEDKFGRTLQEHIFGTKRCVD